MSKAQTTTIHNATPALEGVHGRAWLFDMDSFAKLHPEDNIKTTVKAWIVEAAWAHPLWAHYQVALITLKDVPGVQPAHIRLKDATHEVLVIALNPEITPTVDGHASMLLPINFSGQFIAESDEKATDMLDSCVIKIINGLLNPDTDAVSQWRALFPE